MFDETDQWLVNEEEKNFEKKIQYSFFCHLSLVVKLLTHAFCVLFRSDRKNLRENDSYFPYENKERQRNLSFYATLSTMTRK